jgi:FkbM family methyltransferase
VQELSTSVVYLVKRWRRSTEALGGYPARALNPPAELARGSRLRTRFARGLTRFVDVSRIGRLEQGPLRPLLRRGTYRISVGVAHGLALDASMMSLASVQAGGVLRGLHEMQVQEALRRCLPEGGTFVDVGAHIGFMSLCAARIVGAGGTVVAIEPVPENSAAVRRNAQLNGFGQIRVIEGAASSCAGEAELITVSDTLWTRLGHVGDHPLAVRRSPVRTVALDDLVDAGEIAVPDVVKIDVEGAELEVLDGMRGLLAQHRTTVLCEMHDTNRAFTDFMNELGYRIVNLDGSRPIPEARGTDHALAEPIATT